MAKKTPESETAAAKPAPRRKVASGKSAPRAAEATQKQEPILVSISGIRGIAGAALSASAILPFVDAFARLVKGNRVVIGHDARPSAKWILPMVEAILRSRGIDVVVVGMVPTPTIGLLVRKLKAAGGINITASHNPIEYNGLKFFSAAGEFITAEMLEELKGLMGAPSAGPAPKIGKRAFLSDAAEMHLETLLNVFPPPERLRASKRPKVIIDCCNSSGAELAPDVADAYGAVFQLIHSDTTKYEFPRGAEPTEKNIVALRKAVAREGADLGFAIDPDADRLAIVDEMGNAIGEERTLVLAADSYFMFNKKPTTIVVNLSTSRAIDDVAEEHGIKVYRTAIGEANVLAGMRKYKARIGGEGNGGVIVPAVQPGRDVATAIALILMGLQARGGTLSDWNESIPNYSMRKVAVPRGDMSVDGALAKVRKAFAKEGHADDTDGIKISYRDRWVHVRASNTEPILRIFAEAPDDEGAEELIERVSKILS